MPCVTLREETEWIETVQAGWNKICPPFSASVIEEALTSMLNADGIVQNPYGDGDAAAQVVRLLQAQDQ